MTGSFDRVLYVRSTCTDASSLVQCADDANDQTTDETVSFPASSGTTYYFIVDGYASYSYGDFQLQVSLTP